MLTIPLVTADGRVLGVLQIINAQDDEGNFIAFDKDAELYIQHFAENATSALERTFLTRSMVLRMARMAEMRDPKETGTHVTRVSKYSVEISWCILLKIMFTCSEFRRIRRQWQYTRSK